MTHFLRHKYNKPSVDTIRYTTAELYTPPVTREIWSFRYSYLFFRKDPELDLYLESVAKKMFQMFSYTVFYKLMIMLFCVYILKVDTLTIPKW